MNVTLYRTESCPWCHKVEDFLKQHDIKHESIDVGKDAKAAQHMIEKSGQQGVPVTDIDGEYIIGFDEAKLKKALKI